MTETKRVTLKDVARIARVSTGTVSMVLNDSPLVAAATRAHVRETIERVGYVYDRSGAQLRNKRTGIVGVPICDLSNPYFAEIAVGVEEALGELGLALILGHSAESLARQQRFLQTAREHNVEGIILMPALGTTKKDVEAIVRWKIPLVMVSRYAPGIATDYAGSDNRAAAALATRHLIELGHERIAFVGATKRTSTARDRTRGYRNALKAAGIEVSPDFVVACEASRENGFHAARDLLAQRRPPTAVVCFNDLLAFGVMLGLRSLGVEPGRQCSVVGMDDVAEAGLWRPALTTVTLPSKAIGLSAGVLLRRRLENPGRPPEKIILVPELVVRGTSGPPTASPDGNPDQKALAVPRRQASSLKGG
jgi:LacI family transcriptional regulator